MQEINQTEIKTFSIVDDPTGIDSQEKDKSLQSIRWNIEQMYKYGDQERIFSDDLSDITTDEVHQYLLYLTGEKNLNIKQMSLVYSEISDPKTKADIYDYIQAYPDAENDKPLSTQRVYFIEGGKSAVTIIPIQIAKEIVAIDIRLLDSSPSFIRRIWEEERNNHRDIEHIDFIKPENIKRKKK